MSKGIFYLIILTVFLLVIWEINEIVTIGFQYTGIKRLIAIFFCFCIILFWKYYNEPIKPHNKRRRIKV